MECLKNTKKDCWRMLLDETPACNDDHNYWCCYHTDVVQFKKDWGWKRDTEESFNNFRKGIYDVHSG